MTRLLAAFVVAAVSACAAIGPRPAAGPPADDLAARLDCLRERHLALVAAHRGQPDQTAAENAMSSFRASLAAGVPVLEIDVATTKDGVLALMHDDTLDRTTTGSGAVVERTWAEVQAANLETPGGNVLDERVPRFADVLEWGRNAGVRFELDVKRTTKFSDVVAAVQAARMVDRVIVVTYNFDDAVTVHRLDPRLVVSVTIETADALAAARARLDLRRIMGWTGTSDPASRPFAALRAAGVEPIFGTLGRPRERLDDVYLTDGDPSEYDELVRAGVVMIASDAAVAAQRAIGSGWRACFR